MRPPICRICGSKDPSCRLISFKKSEENIAWEKKMEETGGVGHPPWMEWFCEEHARLAEQHANLTRPEAMKKILQLASKATGQD